MKKTLDEAYQDLVEAWREFALNVAYGLKVDWMLRVLTRAVIKSTVAIVRLARAIDRLAEKMNKYD